MIKALKNWLVALVFVCVISGSLVSLGSFGDTASAAPLTVAECEAKSRFMTFPTWFRGLLEVNSAGDDCQLVSADKVGGVGPFIWVIVLNVIEMALNAVGYIAVGFIVYGGFLLMTGRGEPENITKARLTIRDAVVGLVVSIGSIAIVNLIINFGILK